MKLGFTEEDEIFRHTVSEWLQTNLQGEFSPIRFRGGPGDEHMFFKERVAWEKRLFDGGWTCIGWPKEYGGRGCSLEQQVIFHEEYARAGGPGRVGHIGEGLIGPALIAFGSNEQKSAFYQKFKMVKSFGAKAIPSQTQALIWPISQPGLNSALPQKSGT